MGHISRATQIFVILRDSLHARSTCRIQGVPKLGTWAEALEYSAVRTHRGAPNAMFAARYPPVGAAYRSVAGRFGCMADRTVLSVFGRQRRARVQWGDLPQPPAATACWRRTAS